MNAIAFNETSNHNQYFNKGYIFCRIIKYILKCHFKLYTLLSLSYRNRQNPPVRNQSYFEQKCIKGTFKNMPSTLCAD